MGIDFCSIIISRKIAFDLIFKRVTKEPQSDFQSQFPMSKNIAVFLNIIHWKNAILGEHLFFKIRSNFWWLIWKLVNVIIKLFFFDWSTLSLSWPLSSKLQHWGHANIPMWPGHRKASAKNVPFSNWICFYIIGFSTIDLERNLFAKGGFFSESVIRFSNLQKKFPKNYPELEI